MLANKQLRENLKPAGYYEVAHTPGLWRHKRRPMHFTLIVDDFGVKLVGKEHVDHLLHTLRKKYSKVTEDWTRSLHAGITLNRNYEDGWVDASMPRYIAKARQRF